MLLFFYRITVHCVYYLSGLFRLFQLHKFLSDFPGFGSVEHIKSPGMWQLFSVSRLCKSWPVLTLHWFFAIGLQVTVSPSVDGTTAPEPTTSSAGKMAKDLPMKYGEVLQFAEGVDKVGVLHPFSMHR